MPKERIFSGVVPWCYPVHATRIDDHTALMSFQMTKHADFRGMAELPTDINRHIFKMCTTHIECVIELKIADLSLEPMTWSLQRFSCNLNSHNCDFLCNRILSSIEVENAVIKREWLPLLEPWDESGYMPLLLRLQQDIATSLRDIRM